MCSHNCTIITACILSNDDTCTVRFPRFISVLIIIINKNHTDWLQFWVAKKKIAAIIRIYTHALLARHRLTRQPGSAGQISVSAAESAPTARPTGEFSCTGPGAPKSESIQRIFDLFDMTGRLGTRAHAIALPVPTAQQSIPARGQAEKDSEHEAGSNQCFACEVDQVRWAAVGPGARGPERLWPRAMAESPPAAVHAPALQTLAGFAGAVPHRGARPGPSGAIGRYN